jgi:hypothetical protein
VLVLDMIEILPPFGKYKYDAWRIHPVKCYIDNFMCLRSCIRNVNSHLQHPHGQVQGREGRHQRSQKLDNPKYETDNLVSLSQASTSTAESSSSKRSWTLPHRNSKGRDRHLQDYHPVPYFSIGPPMPGPWEPPPMMYPPCPPWAGWYGPWALPPMQFHPGWPGPTEGFGHRGYYVGDGR